MKQWRRKLSPNELLDRFMCIIFLFVVPFAVYWFGVRSLPHIRTAILGNRVILRNEPVFVVSEKLEKIATILMQKNGDIIIRVNQKLVESVEFYEERKK